MAMRTAKYWIPIWLLESNPSLLKTLIHVKFSSLIRSVLMKHKPVKIPPIRLGIAIENIIDEISRIFSLFTSYSPQYWKAIKQTPTLNAPKHKTGPNWFTSPQKAPAIIPAEIMRWVNDLKLNLIWNVAQYRKHPLIDAIIQTIVFLTTIKPSQSPSPSW